jgi:pimeloyl-ACP methyl ester carboxylesterase
MTLADMADDTIAFLESIVKAPAFLFGHSMGAPVGLLAAQRHPDMVRGLIFSEGVYHFEGWSPGVLDPLPPNVLDFLGDLYGKVSPYGRDHWPDVWGRMNAEHQVAPALTTDDLAAITTPALLMFADDETEVEVEHVHAMHRAMPRAQLAIVPGTGHGLPSDKPDLCNRLVLDFIKEASS